MPEPASSLSSTTSHSGSLPLGSPFRLRVGELLVLWAAVALTYHGQRDPARLLAWVFGRLPLLPHLHLHPYLALLLGLGNLVLLLLVVAVFSGGRLAEWLRRLATGWFVLALAVVPVLSQVEVRLHVDEAAGNAAPYRSPANDGGLLQMEMASAALRRGENPYAIRYDRPPMTRSADSSPAGWQSIGYAHNPAFDHLPYLPGMLYLSAPVDWAMRRLLGFYDQRLLYLAAAFLLATILSTMVAAGPARRMVFVATLLNPLWGRDLVVGRNDVLLLVPLALFARFLLAERFRAAAIAMGIALAMKQQALFALPFFLLLVFLRRGRALRPSLGDAWPVLAIPTAAVLPFVLWDARAFFEDTLFWNLGLAADAYPVRWDGLGLSPLAFGLGLVEQPSGPNPYGLLALPAILVGLAGLGAWLWRRPTPARTLVAAGALLYLALATSRFFSNNYLMAVVVLWAVALLGERSSQRIAESSSSIAC